MSNYTRLSDAEFEVMKTVWECDIPVSSKIINDKLIEKNWKPQTILTLLARLVTKQFLDCEKVTNKNYYTPLIIENDYLQYETNEFVKKYHKDSVKGLVNTLYDGNDISKEDISDLKDYLDLLVK